jgi:hypothetical protein
MVTVNAVSIGLLIHAVVCAVVMVVAGILVAQLFAKTLDHRMRVYGLFWFMTTLLWLQNVIRYAALGFGYDLPRLLSHFLSQTTVYLTGPVLLYFVGLQVFKSNRVATLLATQAALASTIAVWLLALPNGINLEPVLAFTAEASPNRTSMRIFVFEVAVVSLLLAYDFSRRLLRWRRDRTSGTPYEAVYDIAIIAYLAIGGLDLAKVTTNWGLLIFRLFYSAAFLAVYLTFRQEQAAREQYLVQAAAPA